MGYSTTFEGKFNLDRKLDDDTYKLLYNLATTRRMKRNVDAKYGIEGEFYFEGSGFWGQDVEDNVIDRNRPPTPQPGLWCQWIPSDDRLSIKHDEKEKFYCYIDWLKYIINKILITRNYILNGEVKWLGEAIGDCGILKVVNNKIEFYKIEDERENEYDDDDDDEQCK